MSRTYFFWDPLSDNILQERDESGAVTAEYTAEPGLYGNIISQNKGGVESQFHYDAQGSTLAVTDDNQNVIDTFAYTAFGEVTERTGTTEVPFQYIGQKGYYTDGLTGQIMARRRPYEPVRARWRAVDPLGVHSYGINAYTYVTNRPTAFFDGSGLGPSLCSKLSTAPGEHNIKTDMAGEGCPVGAGIFVVKKAVLDAALERINSILATLGIPFSSESPCPCGICNVFYTHDSRLVIPLPFPEMRQIYCRGRSNRDCWLPEEHDNKPPPDGGGYKACSLTIHIVVVIDYSTSLGVCA
jgi:RHS repeat-associated protein